ncbi:polysaccharide deacetylase family protein [Minwuia sp.]|uniref:polysaccharide deacetylase family protein n=1 Tax=Minwuia sp. TaxID=2493630 RepID=UPI003A90C0AE
MMKKAALAWLILLGAVAPVFAADHAVVFAYHRFGEDGVPATNIRLAQFEAHLDHLEEGGFTVWPLSRIVKALRDGTDLPDRTVALTADDAYRSVMTEAWPRLKQRGWTMTLFVATDGVDSGIRGYLNWDEIRRLKAEGMEIGAHSAAHGHMAEMAVEEARDDLERSRDRFRAELDAQPDLLVYPYGEYSAALIDVARQVGYSAAFGQHSGALSRSWNMFALPRFAMNEAYGKIDRFRLAASSLPLDVTDLEPADTVIRPGAYPRFGFRILSDVRAKTLNCFHSSSGQKQTLSIDGAAVSFQPPGDARPGRSRYNCTAPAGQGRWYWHGRQFVVPGGTD